MKMSEPEAKNNLPSRFTLQTERLVSCMILSLADTFIIKFLLFSVLTYCGMVSTVLQWNFASLFAITMTLNWWFGLKEIRESRKILLVMNHNVDQILNMTAIMVIKNSVQTLSNIFENVTKSTPKVDDDDNNVDK